MKTLVLTSKQNFVWASMQEIIPFLVETWKATESPKHAVRVVDIDELPLSQFLLDLVQADQIVLTCFTPKIFKLAQYARFEMSSPARFITHLHNQATIACWPIRHWGRSDLFREKDVFVSSCERDANCLKVTYPEAQISIIPFSYVNFDQHIHHPVTKTADEIPFVFIGRLSSQKNLHTLLLSFSYLQKLAPDLKTSLTFIGKEDGLGSPNMGMQDQGYLQFLTELTQKLELESSVDFLGFQPREEISRLLKSHKQIFIAPSLHSDENFGMAAFQCLEHGHAAVLSDWGGHTDFKKHFPNQVHLASVQKTPAGPVILPLELAQQMKTTAENYYVTSKNSAPERYLFKNIVAQNQNILHAQESRIANDSLKTSGVADQVFSRINPESFNSNTAIFKNYEDSLSFPFFESYGMSPDFLRPGNLKDPQLVPWVQGDLIQDPHRGHFEIPKLPESERNVWLAERGWLVEGPRGLN